MAQSFKVAPEYVEEITFTTKVSSIEYRVSNQIQVSINIVGIRYRTSTNLNVQSHAYILYMYHNATVLNGNICSIMGKFIE